MNFLLFGDDEDNDVVSLPSLLVPTLCSQWSARLHQFGSSLHTSTTSKATLRVRLQGTLKIAMKYAAFNLVLLLLQRRVFSFVLSNDFARVKHSLLSVSRSPQLILEDDSSVQRMLNKLVDSTRATGVAAIDSNANGQGGGAGDYWMSDINAKIAELKLDLTHGVESSTKAASFALGQLSSIADQVQSVWQNPSFDDSLSVEEIQTLLEKLATDLPTLSSTSPTVAVALTTVIVSVVATMINDISNGPAPSRPYPLSKYDADAARAYFSAQPLKVAARTLQILLSSLGWATGLLSDLLNQSTENDEQRGKELAELLVQLGPTFIKVGQSLSIRTDLLSPGYIQGLATLQDNVPPFRGSQSIVEEALGPSLFGNVVVDDWDAPIAAASLGQVFKARLLDRDEPVAVKVQRPGMMEQIALDMHILRTVGGILKSVFNLNTDLVGTVDAWGKGFVDGTYLNQELICPFLTTEPTPCRI